MDEIHDQIGRNVELSEQADLVRLHTQLSEDAECEEDARLLIVPGATRHLRVHVR